MIALRWTITASFGKLVDFVADVASVFFALVYVYLAWDMLAVFVPRVRAWGQK
jgi:phosphatidylglycerophosphate synthase